MRVRAIRGAVAVGRDDRGEILEATRGLLADMMHRNDLVPDDVVSVFITATPDLVSAFPAEVVRTMDIRRVPVLCARELAVEGAMPRVIRVLMHAHVDRSLDDIEHVYVGETRRLRDDL